MIKIAIIGGTGLLGSNLANIYSSKAEVKCFSRQKSINVNDKLNKVIDFKNLDRELDNYFKDWNPDIIINTVAIVDLNFCEKNFDFAYQVNCKIAEKLAKVAIKYSSYFIHISTDHFFDDNQVKHNELAVVKLLNNYAITKYQAEKKVLEVDKNSLIVRTNIIGFRNNNKETFFEWLLNNLKNNKNINCYSNYFTSPIEVTLLGEILLKCFDRKLIGIFNISSSEVISKYDFALRVAEIFSLDKALIKKVELKNDNSLKRALSLGLNVNKIEKALEIKMPNIHAVLKRLFKTYKEKILYE